MSEIDVQNSRQIRDPMDVLITMSLANSDISMTYSGYSMAKVADGELDETSWPMRKLADLQGDGFPLDGSCVLYNASTAPSQTNGKLGVRSNVGETVTVTATGNDTMASIGASVTGAESVTINGTTTPITGTNVVVPLLASSATMVFNPASETRRIEISTILPEADFKITNENLIRATVSLRSDLSIIDPTLPESEINIEAYFDEDVSEAVAAIPEDTPIKYQAGYPGDMSPERKFYVTGQVTWADNVLSIQGVDAVHFLDRNLPLGSIGDDFYLNRIYDLIYRFSIDICGASLGRESFSGPFYSPRYKRVIVPRGVNFRDFIAYIMNAVHLENLDPAWSAGGHTEFWINYVDAGIPSLSWRKPISKWGINESDCGNCKKNVELKINRITYTHTTYESKGNDPQRDGVQCGSAFWVKGTGAFVSYNGGDDYYDRVCIGVNCSEYGFPRYFGFTVEPIIPLNPRGSLVSGAFRYIYNNGVSFGWIAPLFNGDLEPDVKAISDRDELYSFVPWNCIYDRDYAWQYLSQSAAWSGMASKGLMGTDSESTDIPIYGNKLTKGAVEKTISASDTGANITIELPIEGSANFAKTGKVETSAEAYPEPEIRQMLSRSNITGSFTWKGDPRMQPRDVVEWERLDGTTTTITLENITLTHEGGGMMAEITYREGVV